jgi:hypothetical protein
MVKISHDELFVCCMTSTYLHDSFSTFVDLKNNYMMPSGNVCVTNLFELYVLYNMVQV